MAARVEFARRKGAHFGGALKHEGDVQSVGAYSEPEPTNLGVIELLAPDRRRREGLA